MEMNDVLRMLMTSGAVEEVSKNAGITAEDAVAVMQDVLPVLLKGMQGQATNKSTQEGFLKALTDHSKDDTSDMTKFVKNVDTVDGAKIVNHLLGAQTEEVAAKAKKKSKSGIDTKTVLKIMAILAPLLMSKMGSTATAKKSSKSSSNDMLDIVGGLLDGVDAGDVLKIVTKLI